MDVYETMWEIDYDLIRQDSKHHNITVNKRETGYKRENQLDVDTIQILEKQLID